MVCYIHSDTQKRRELAWLELYTDVRTRGNDKGLQKEERERERERERTEREKCLHTGKVYEQKMAGIRKKKRGNEGGKML